MRERQLLTAIAAIGLFAALQGCGGTTGGLTGINTNPYQGQYSGTWTGSPSTNTGTAQITIAQNGVTTGTFHNNSTNQDGALSAQTSNEGSFVGTLTWPSQPSASLRGSFVKGANNHLLGNFTQTINGMVTSGSFDLAPM